MVGFAVASYRENKVGGRSGTGDRHFHVTGSEYCEETGNLASGNYIERNSRTGRNNGASYDE